MSAPPILAAAPSSNLVLVAAFAGGFAFALAVIWIVSRRARSSREDRDPRALERLRETVADAQVPMAVLDMAGSLVLLNAACEELLGWSQRELAFAGFSRQLQPNDSSFRDRFAELMAGERHQFHITQRWCRQDGDIVSFLVSASPAHKVSGSGCYVLLTFDDMTGCHAATESTFSVADLSAQQRASDALTGARDADAAKMGAMQCVSEEHGWDAAIFWSIDERGAMLTPDNVWTRPLPDAQVFMATEQKQTLARGQSIPGQAWDRDEAVWSTDLVNALRSPHTRRAEDAGVRTLLCCPVPGDSGMRGVMEFLSWRSCDVFDSHIRTVTLVATQLHTALNRIESERSVRVNEAKYRDMAEMAAEAIISIDADSAIEFVNNAAERIFGYSRTEMMGRSLTMLMPEGLRQAHRSGMRRYLESGRRRVHWDNIEFPGVRKDGTEILLNMSLAEVGHGDRPIFSGFIRDVTHQKREESALVYQALHDVLTGLPNRSLLQDRLERAVLVSHRHALPFALLFLDLDRFKDVNDSFGHRCGDVLLQRVAARIVDTVRESDTVARLGGDEFAVLLPSTDPRGATFAATRILAALEAPLDLDGHSVDIDGSIGVAFYPAHGVDAAALMRRTDMAMYAAKRASSGYEVYSPTRDEANSQRLQATSELRQAIERNQMLLHYQPKLNLHDGTIEQVEALVRWQRPDRGLTFPDGFIPLAEETGLMRPLTEWVLNDALRQHCEWLEQGLLLRIAVNFSARFLHDPDLIRIVTDLLDRWKVAPSNLGLEITESAIMVNPERAKTTLTDLHAAGIVTSIDDFGTGHSSLAYLRRLPFDEIKIDKSFVLDLATDRDDASIVRSVIALGHNFGLKVVGEGVDNKRSLDMLRAMGCDVAQGYFISRPQSAENLAVWLKTSEWLLSTAS